MTESLDHLKAEEPSNNQVAENNTAKNEYEEEAIAVGAQELSDSSTNPIDAIQNNNQNGVVRFFQTIARKKAVIFWGLGTTTIAGGLILGGLYGYDKNLTSQPNQFELAATADNQSQRNADSNTEVHEQLRNAASHVVKKAAEGTSVDTNLIGTESRSYGMDVEYQKLLTRLSDLEFDKNHQTQLVKSVIDKMSGFDKQLRDIQVEIATMKATSVKPDTVNTVSLKLERLFSDFQNVNRNLGDIRSDLIRSSEKAAEKDTFYNVKIQSLKSEADTLKNAVEKSETAISSLEEKLDRTRWTSDAPTRLNYDSGVSISSGFESPSEVTKIRAIDESNIVRNLFLVSFVDGMLTLESDQGDIYVLQITNNSRNDDSEYLGEDLGYLTDYIQGSSDHSPYVLTTKGFVITVKNGKIGSHN
ncbi:hypothetical protein [Marinomonas sp. 2405UD68-3]|uniref:hypothetical protein n=1 Tax=Marinomonas sp. 2405UD68-3 TaxID=3391835 RepID=UPI0039C9DECC